MPQDSHSIETPISIVGLSAFSEVSFLHKPDLLVAAYGTCVEVEHRQLKAMETKPTKADLNDLLHHNRPDALSSAGRIADEYPTHAGTSVATINRRQLNVPNCRPILTIYDLVDQLGVVA